MEQSKKLDNNLHQVLKDLIKQKSLRDDSNFTAYQLAKELDIPRSVISSLMNPDETKRVKDPRINTLLKIVNYFRAQGFDISIESLLGINSRTNVIEEPTAYYYAESEVRPSSGIKISDIFQETYWLDC